MYDNSKKIDDSEDESENFDDEIWDEIIANEIDDTNSDSKEPSNGCDHFERITNSKLSDCSDTEEIIRHKKFILIVDKLVCKFPFLKINEFIEEFVNGQYTKHFFPKYNFSKKSDFAMCLRKTALNMPAKREKYLSESNKSDYSRHINLKKTSIFTSYNFLKSECDYFQEELLFLYNYNWVRSIVLINYLKNISSLEEIIKNNAIIDVNKSEHFNLKLNSDQIDILENSFDEIKNELYAKKMIQYFENTYVLDVNFDSIEYSIKQIVEDEIEGITYGNLVPKLFEKHKFISFIPHYDLLNILLTGYVDLGFFKVEYGFKDSDQTEHRYFTITNYENQKLSGQTAQNLPFYGRQNDPHQFIQDIKYLRKGDFDDDDDQVTRIAGLILAGTQNMVSETEDFSQFDFAVNMTGFKPTKEQEKIMMQSKLVLLPETKIIHIKVMVNEQVDLETVKSIQKILPEKQQAMIISFENVSDEITSLISNDHAIQIIDKKVLQLWAEITPEIPCRKGSVVKIMQGQYIGKIAKLNHIDYTTGKASVKIIGLDEEKVVQIGSLKEINLFDDPILDEHILLYTNYFEFLNILHNKSSNIEFNKALFNQENNCDEFVIPRDDWTLKKDVAFASVYGNINSRIRANGKKFENKFSCSCEYFQNENNLCFHLISLLSEIGIRCNLFTETWNSEENILSECMSDL
jgi:hypothetical protein